ncbi:MAG: thioredoxin family protein [Cyanobacteria bacterium P01_H01_bin.74]
MMLKRSLIMVLSVVSVIFLSSFVTQLWLNRNVPSSYDPGIPIQEAFKTSKTPILVEFYSDTCSTCRRLTPVIHSLYEGRYHNRLTLVMMDVTDPDNRDIAQLFGVNVLPGIYIFDHKRMKKHAIPPEAFRSEATLTAEMDRILKKLEV